MKQTLQQILDRVKEPETNLSISELGLVEMKGKRQSIFGRNQSWK